VGEGISFLFVLVEVGGILAPIAFIFFHIFRQFLFIPVPLVCMAGGILFGSFLGTIYSLIGLVLCSIFFYFVIKRLPKTHEKLSPLQRKWFGTYRNITVMQTAILRLIPFVHFHLLNFCLMERDQNFKVYVRNTFFSSIPLSFLYSVFGEFISRFTPQIMVLILVVLLILVDLFREKISIIKWEEFFKQSQIKRG
jgi:uncharacterized membrane protein YdjX (TVP38/TMEM64 family)